MMGSGMTKRILQYVDLSNTMKRCDTCVIIVCGMHACGRVPEPLPSLAQVKSMFSVWEQEFASSPKNGRCCC